MFKNSNVQEPTSGLRMNPAGFRLEGEFTITIINVGSKICSHGGNLGAQIAGISSSQTALGKKAGTSKI